MHVGAGGRGGGGGCPVGGVADGRRSRLSFQWELGGGTQKKVFQKRKKHSNQTHTHARTQQTQRHVM